MFDALRNKVAAMIAGKTSGRSFASTWSNPPRRNTREWLETYSRSPRLSVVTKIAEDLSFCGGRLIKRDINGDDEDLPDNHPFLRFWQNPNPMPQFTMEAIWQLHETYLLLVGEAFVVIEKNYLGYPAELWPIPPHWVTGTPTEGRALYIIRTPSGLLAEIHVDDMFVQMELNPENPYGRGLGQAQSIADEVEIDEYAAAFEKRFFYNDATPSSVIAIEGASAEAVERFGSDWNNRFRGVANSHRTAVTSGKVSVAKLAENMKDLDMINGRIFLRDSVIAHFHVPREIMGITENSNRATAEAAQYIYAQNVLMPRIRKRQRALNIQLIPYWGDDVRYEFDEIIPRNQEFAKAKAIEGWNSGLLTRNESRKELDYEPTDNGDVFQAPLLFGYVSPEQNLTGYGQEPPTAGSEDNYDTVYVDEDPKTGIKEIKASISRIDRQAVQQLSRAQQNQTRRAENALTQYMSRTRRSMTAAFKATGVAQKDEADAASSFAALQVQLGDITSTLERADRITSFVEKMVDWNQDEEQVRQILSNIWQNSYDESSGIMKVLYSMNNPNAQQAQDIFKIMGGRRISSDISETTRRGIVDIIDKGLAEGTDLDELARQIADSTVLSPGRAKLIAHQESANAMSASNYNMMVENGVRRHKWLSQPIADVPREDHRRMSGQVRNVGELFSNGLKFPRDPEGPPEETIHCNCWAVPLRERDTPLVTV